MTNNYFKVQAHSGRPEFLFCDDTSAADSNRARMLAVSVACDYTRSSVTVWKAGKNTGGIHEVGQTKFYDPSV